VLSTHVFDTEQHLPNEAPSHVAPLAWPHCPSVVIGEPAEGVVAVGVGVRVVVGVGTMVVGGADVGIAVGLGAEVLLPPGGCQYYVLILGSKVFEMRNRAGSKKW